MKWKTNTYDPAVVTKDHQQQRYNDKQILKMMKNNSNPPLEMTKLTDGMAHVHMRRKPV